MDRNKGWNGLIQGLTFLKAYKSCKQVHIIKLLRTHINYWTVILLPSGSGGFTMHFPHIPIYCQQTCHIISISILFTQHLTVKDLQTLFLAYYRQHIWTPEFYFLWSYTIMIKTRSHCSISKFSLTQINYYLQDTMVLHLQCVETYCVSCKKKS